MKRFLLGATLAIVFSLATVPASSQQPPVPAASAPATPQAAAAAQRKYLLEQVGPLAVIQIYADGFAQLSPNQRLLAYYLAQAGIAGDPIYYDQISPYGLELKQLLEGIWTHSEGIAPGVLEKLRHYTKLVWIYHGNYDLSSQQKFLPDFTPAELPAAAHQALKNGANFGVKTAKSLDARLSRLQQPIFDPQYAPFLTAKTPPPGQDLLTASANNLYERVTLADLENFKERYPLNSTVIKRGGKITEEVWRADTPDGKIPPGRYAAYIRRIIANLEKAAAVAEPQQADVLRKLVRFYQTGSKDDWYAYNIAWVQAPTTVDAINGFIEQYLDPRSEKGDFESTVSFVDAAQTRLMRDFAANAQYFEDREPWRDQYKKQGVQPPVANAITVVSEAGGHRADQPRGHQLAQRAGHPPKIRHEERAAVQCDERVCGRGRTKSCGRIFHYGRRKATRRKIRPDRAQSAGGHA